MATYGSLIVELGANVARLQGDMGRAVAIVDRSASGIRRAADHATAAIAAIGIGRGLSGIVNTAREFGRLQASLTTVTGSSQAAQTAFAWLERFAATTPFQLAEVVQAFTKLDALGLKPTEESLRSFGNTASALGKTLDQFVEAVADAATGEFERLKEFGIRASSEGERVTFTFRGVSQTIQKESAAITEYLQRIGEVQFAGAMERQAETLDGALSNLEDATASLARAMGDAGLTTAVTNAARAMTSIANEMATATREGDNMLRMLDGLAKGIADVFRGSDQQRLGELVAEEIGLDQRIAKLSQFLARPDVLRSERERVTKVLVDLQAERARIQREIEGLRAVLPPEQTGAAPRLNRPPPSAVESVTVIAPSAKELEKAAREAKRVAEELQRESDSVRAYLQDYAREREATFAREIESARARTEALRQAVESPRERAIRDLAEYEKVFGADSQEYGRKAIEVFNQLEGEIDNVDAAGERTRQTMADLGATFSSAFEDAILNGEKFSDVLGGLAKDIARLLLRDTVTDPLARLFSSGANSVLEPGGGIGGFLRGLFGNARGGLYKVAGSGVGERPVAFTAQPGEFVAVGRAQSGGGGGGGVTIINNTGVPFNARDRGNVGGRRVLELGVLDALAGAVGTGAGTRELGLAPGLASR